jgi:drug/metabolite transporter (DMT)-like permease
MILSSSLSRNLSGMQMSVVYAAVAGFAFGALTVAVRAGLSGAQSPELGAFAATALGAALCATVGVPGAVAGGVRVGTLWPYLIVGGLAPGVSQICLTFAVRSAGAARTAIVMGSAPMLSVLIAFATLAEPIRPDVLAGTLAIVLGASALASERGRPHRSHVRGALLAGICATLFAVRDNLLRSLANGEHVAPFAAATATLAGATAVIGLYMLCVRPTAATAQIGRTFVRFAPAGAALAVGYGFLLTAFAGGRVSVVSPLNATGALWAVALAALTFRRAEQIGRSALVAATLIVIGGVTIGASS